MTATKAHPESAPAEASSVAAEVTVGEKLRAAREARGLTIKEVAQQIYLGERQIAALETGDLAVLPGKTFVRGFVRNYARAVQLDAVPLLALLDQVDRLKAPKLELPESTHVIMAGQEGQRLKWNKDTLMIAAGIILVLLAASTYYFFPAHLFVEKTAATYEETVSPEITATEPVASEENAITPVAPEETVAPTSETSAPVNGNTLNFKFEGESWVEVRDKNGQILMSRLNLAGETRNVTGTPPYEATIGNAAHVRLSYKGQPVALKPDAESGVARLKLP
jgi:cytoskeleton protein RodZ